MKVARIYMRVSTKEQDIRRQDALIEKAQQAGYYIAGIYRDTQSGVRYDRPELLRMIDDLQPGDVVIAEQMDRLSRGPLPEAEKLVAAIRTKGARLSVPGIVDLSDIASGTDGIAKIVLENNQELILKIALQLAHEDWANRRERQRQGIRQAQQEGRYKGKQPDKSLHKRIIALRESGQSIADTARLAGCSDSQVKRVWKAHQAQQAG